MMCRSLLPITVAAFLAVLGTTHSGNAQTVPSSDQPFVQVVACNAQPEYAPAAFFSPALYPAGPGPFLDVEADGPLYALLAPAPIGGALSIDYTNATNRAMKTIDFGFVVRGALVAEVHDAGKFTPHAAIKHDFEISPSVFPLGTALSQCVPLRITYVDGSSWINPHLPH